MTTDGHYANVVTTLAPLDAGVSVSGAGAVRITIPRARIRPGLVALGRVEALRQLEQATLASQLAERPQRGAFITLHFAPGPAGFELQRIAGLALQTGTLNPALRAAFLWIAAELDAANRTGP